MSGRWPDGGSVGTEQWTGRFAFPYPLLAAHPQCSPRCQTRTFVLNLAGDERYCLYTTHARARSPRHRQRRSLRLSLSQRQTQETLKPHRSAPTPPTLTVTHRSPRPLPHPVTPRPAARWLDCWLDPPRNPLPGTPVTVPVTHQVWTSPRQPIARPASGMVGPPLQILPRRQMQHSWKNPFPCWLVTPPAPPPRVTPMAPVTASLLPLQPAGRQPGRQPSSKWMPAVAVTAPLPPLQ